MSQLLQYYVELAIELAAVQIALWAQAWVRTLMHLYSIRIWRTAP